MKKHLLIIPIIALFIACNKSDDASNNPAKTFDTIYPMSYFPAYPGSYWIYSNGDTLKIRDKYELFAYNKSCWEGVPDVDTIFLPKFNANSVYNNRYQDASYVYRYSISTLNYRLPFRTILSENLNSIFQIAENFAGNAAYGKTVKIDTTIEVNKVKFEKVIVIINYSWNSGVGYLPWTIREYYAKDVGLIKRESRSILDTSLISLEFELVKFKINK